MTTVRTRTRGLAAASIARKAAALRSGFRFLARRGLVEDDPAAGLGVPRGPKRLPVVLKPRQVDRLLAGPDPVDPVVPEPVDPVDPVDPVVPPVGLPPVDVPTQTPMLPGTARV